MSETGARRIGTIEGTGVPVPGHDIDTDRIIPARFLKSITFEGLDQHVFEDDRKGARERGETHPFDEPAYQGGSVLLVNRNFGCGSSREHAPQALQRWGVNAVVGESFSEIFFGNSVALGMPCVTGAAAEIVRLQELVTQAPGLVVSIDLEAMQLACGNWRMPVSLPPAARESFLDGTWDATGLLLDRYEQVEETMRRVPYLNGWRT